MGKMFLRGSRIAVLILLLLAAISINTIFIYSDITAVPGGEKGNDMSKSEIYDYVRKKIIQLEKFVQEVEKLQEKADEKVLKEKYEELIKSCDKVLEIKSSNTDIWKAIYYKGMALYELERYEQAEVVLREAADKSLYLIEKTHDNDLSGIYYYLGRMQMMKKDAAGAVESLKKTMDHEFDKKYTDKLQNDALFDPIKNTDEYYNLIGFSLMIDQKIIRVKSHVQDGVVLGYAGEIAECLGANMKWEGYGDTVVITKLNKQIVFRIGDKIAKVNGKEVELQAAPMIDEKKLNSPYPDLRGDAVLAPIEFIAKELGQKISYEIVDRDPTDRVSTGPAIVIREDESRVKYTEKQKKWAIAPSANINIRNYGYYNVMGGDYRYTGHVLSVKKALENSWGIYNREDYFRILEWLRNEGHTKAYRELEAQVSPEVFKQIQDMIKQGKEIPFTVKFFINNKEVLKDKGLIAWDYCRIVQVTGWSYIAGYITIEEAYDICMEAARVLQKTYTSWENMSEHYMKGYEFWSEQDSNDDSTEAYYRNKINQYILSDEESPFNTLPWNLKLD